MASSQQDHRNISLKLSEVLSDIGVNDEMVMLRRNGTLYRESSFYMRTVITNSDKCAYLFGSQSEGTTTTGIHSDIDILMCFYDCHINQDLSNWKPNVTNLLIVQDETTAPGYCFLQRLQNDAPLPVSVVPDNNHYKDGKGRILVKNTIFYSSLGGRQIGVQHGPAIYQPGSELNHECDMVPAFHCERWPTQGRSWLHRRSISGWPSIQLKTESERSGCLLVPVGSKLNDLNELEWRISTSHAERYLMFSLNITHLRCVVLMKMLLNSHINGGCDKVISSYMCKTALLHCVENTNTVFWQEHNLILCLNQILRELYNYVLNINCPHFIIPENNLMAGKFSSEQQQRLLDNILHIIDSNGRVLFEILTDDIGARLQIKLNIIREFHENLPSAVSVHRRVSGNIVFSKLVINMVSYIGSIRKLNKEDDIRAVIQQLLCMFNRCEQRYVGFSHLEQEACILILPLLCSTIGSVLAAFDIMLNKPLSDIAIEWCKLGVNSDVSAGWLKLATVLYRSGDINATKNILRHVDQRYDRNIVMPVCTCHSEKVAIIRRDFESVADQIQNDALRHFVSYCVIFIRCEINIVPYEMQQEYSRSTQEDIQCRKFEDELWMDFAVVDSLPYLYFLQYKTYSRLNSRRKQEIALHNLQQVIRDERNLRHKETALNLLGQCMEHENLPNEAFNCYERSLLVRPRHNAAQFHRSRMLS